MRDLRVVCVVMAKPLSRECGQYSNVIVMRQRFRVRYTCLQACTHLRKCFTYTLARYSAKAHPEAVPRIVLDFDPPQPEPLPTPEDTSDLVYFLSWAYSARYGASHELSLASLVLRNELAIDMQPLLTFADREIEVPEDEDALERAWQDPERLAATCAAVAAALDSGDERFAEVLETYPRLRQNIEALGQFATQAAGRGARIRVTYLMEES